MVKKSTLVVIVFFGLLISGCGGAGTVNGISPQSPESDASLQPEITDAQGVEMVLVPAGEFEMGSENGDGDERPVHVVYLNAYYMDKFEVTNAQYRACVEAGDCELPKSPGSFSRADYFDSPEFEDFPVVYVDWNMAQTFCEWREARLPAEAEWEKAARGTDGRTYPWGEGIDCDHTNYYMQSGADFTACVGDTSEAGSYEEG
jgi:serine/threonine-protein kinase